MNNKIKDFVLSKSKTFNIVMTVITVGWWYLLYLSCKKHNTKNSIKTAEEKTENAAFEEDIELTIKVVGTNYKQEELKRIYEVARNFNFNKKWEGWTEDRLKKYYNRNKSVYAYELKNEPLPFTKIEKEPTNKYDKNAIKVLVGINEKELIHIGYIPKSDIDNITQNINNITNVKSYITGGLKKEVVFEDNKKNIKKTEAPIYITLKIKLDQ